MATEVKLPLLGEGVTESTIGRWLKAEGDTVARFEPLLEVVTDKVDTEVTSPAAGTLLRIVVPEGETVPVGAVLALLGQPGEEVAETGPHGAPGEHAAQTPAGEAVEAPARGAPEPEAEPVPMAAPGPEPVPMAAPGPEPGPVAGGAGAAGAPVRVTPVAARLAAAEGVDVTRITGTGPSGQVTRADVQQYVAQGGDRAARPGAPAASAARTLGFISPRVAELAAQQGVDLRQVRGTGRDGRITSRDVEAFVASRQSAPAPTAAAAPASAPPAAPPAPAAGGPAALDYLPGQLVTLTPIRKAIAEHMVRSKQTSPHVSTVHEVDMSAVVAAYRQFKEPLAERGIKLTYTAFLVEVTAAALMEHPIVNSSWTDKGVQIHPEINIGLAVALPTGLIVPVVRKANEKSLAGLAREVTDLSNRARNKQLVPDDVQGGTFTITNYGTLGSLMGTPVINQPQAAILGTGTIRKQPVVVEGPEGDMLAIRPMMYLTLTFDHRILDGGTADPFVETIVRKLVQYRA
jgi:pyruvate/2-oxoglutarate dehydrogenase complex dihydrolipoamide acyltransferase (E2) component